MSIKGTMTISCRPDYDQEMSDVRGIIPTSEYSFDFDHSEGMQITVREIQFHFNAFLRSLGYVIGNDNNGEWD